jgi:hypothetical protein
MFEGGVHSKEERSGGKELRGISALIVNGGRTTSLL